MPSFTDAFTNHQASSSSSKRPRPQIMAIKTREEAFLSDGSSQGDVEEWTAGEDEDDSRPPVHAFRQSKTFTMPKEDESEVVRATTRPLFQGPAFDAFVGLKQQTFPNNSSASNLTFHTPVAKQGSSKAASFARPFFPSWVPPAFAFTAPYDLIDLYNEEDSHSYSNRKTRTHSVRMRVSLRALPDLALLPFEGPQRRRYRRRMGVVEVSLVLKARWPNIKDEKSKAPNSWHTGERIIVNLKPKDKQVIDEGERGTAETLQLVENDTRKALLSHKAPRTSIPALDSSGDTLSATVSTATSISLPTPPMSKNSETTFYTSSPYCDDVLASTVSVDDKTGFIPASTATIAGQTQSVPFLQSAASASPSTTYNRPAPPVMPHFQQPPPDLSTPVYHGETYGVGTNYVQPFYAPDGSAWFLSDFNQPNPYQGYMVQQHPYQSNEHQHQQHSTAAVKAHPGSTYLRSHVMQPYDSPPYSPHESFPANQHSYARHVTSQSSTWPLSASSSMQKYDHSSHALQQPQPHPLSLPPQMAQVPFVPSYPPQYSQQAVYYGGYSYDHISGLVLDQSSLVYPQQYQGPPRPLNEYNAVLMGQQGAMLPSFPDEWNQMNAGEYSN